jgi:hypothetical protein
MFEVGGRFRALTGVLLALERVAGGDNKRIFGSAARLPKSVDCRAIVFVRRKALAYFDFRTMLPVQVRFWRIRNASAFMDELLKKRSNATESP